MPPRSTSVAATTERGGRKLSDEARAKLSTTQKAKYAALSDDEKAKRLGNIGRRPRSTDPPATTGGTTNPLDDAPGADPGRGPAPQGPLGAPPRFIVPDLPPLELGDEPDQPLVEGQLVEGAFGVTETQVGQWLEFPFEFIAARRGAHWRLTNSERDLVAGPLARKINEHQATARLLAAGGDWALIAGGLTLIVNARLAEDARRADRHLAAPDGSGPGRGAPPPAGRDRGDAVRRGDQGAGSINGYVPAPVGVGADDDEGLPAVDPEAPGRPLVQAF